MASYGQVKDSQTQQAEHVDVNGVTAKRVITSGYDGVNINDIDIDSMGSIGSLGALTHRNVAVTATEAQVTLTASRRAMTVSNNGAKVIYIGSTGVTNTVYGFALYPRQAYNFGLTRSTFSFYVICAAGDTSTLGVAEFA